MGRYDTNSKMTEPGEYVVKVVSYPQEKTVGGGFTKIDIDFAISGQDKPLKQSYFPNQLKTLFIALGWKEIEPGVYDGDIQEAYGKSFLAELYFEEYKKDDGSTGKARRLRNFKAVDDCPPESAGPENIAWDE
jgi:hypothetical protein